MNIFSKFYCRVYQMIFRFFLPLLPYREPKILKDNKDLVKTFQDKSLTNIMLVTDKNVRSCGLTKDLEEILALNKFNVVVYDDVVINPTTDNVYEAARIYKLNSCQGLIALGGGSVIDCAKAIGACVVCPNKSLVDMRGLFKVSHKLPPLVAIPTTAGTGSEVTVTAVITDSVTNNKYLINDFDLIPAYAMLDANLTATMPQTIIATTGMDALTHAIEAYIGRSTTYSTRKKALRASKLIFENLEICYEDNTNYEARKNMLKASYMAGCAFTKSYVGYVHAIAHTLGGKYNFSHGLANAIILPYMLKKYGKTVYRKLWKLGVFCELFDEKTSCREGARIVIDKIESMNANLGIADKIDAIREGDIPELARLAVKEANPLYPVPKLYTAKQLQKIYFNIKYGNK